MGSLSTGRGPLNEQLIFLGAKGLQEPDFGARNPNNWRIPSSAQSSAKFITRRAFIDARK